MLDKGFGTAYEKFVLAKIFDDIVDKYGIKSICEFPSNDLMGDNSSELEKLGCQVTHQSLNDINVIGKYDLVWCFCEIEQQDNPDWLIEQILNKSQRYALIITQNKQNLGVPLHYLYHFFVRTKWNHGYFKYMTTSIVEKKLVGKNISIIQRGAFDAPWFILDVYETGGLLLRLIPKSLVGGKIKQNELKPSFFENRRFGIKRWLAHHLYLLIEKK